MVDWKKILGGGGRNDPYQNEKSMFAAKPKPPRKYFSDGSMPKGKNAPKPTPRPTDPGTAALAAKAYALLDPTNDRTANATSPSSLMGSTADAATANATSPSSLVQSPPGDPYAAIARDLPDQAWTDPTQTGSTATPARPGAIPLMHPGQNMPAAQWAANYSNSTGQPSQNPPATVYPTIASDKTGRFSYPSISQDQRAVPVENWPSVDKLPPAQDPGVNPFDSGFWWQPKRPGSTPRPDMVGNAPVGPVLRGGNAPVGAVQRGQMLPAPYPNADVQKGARPTPADAWAGWETDPATGMRRKIRNAAGGTGFDSGRFGSGPVGSLFDLLRGGQS